MNLGDNDIPSPGLQHMNSLEELLDRIRAVHTSVVAHNTFLLQQVSRLNGEQYTSSSPMLMCTEDTVTLDDVEVMGSNGNGSAKAAPPFTNSASKGKFGVENLQDIIIEGDSDAAPFEEIANAPLPKDLPAKTQMMRAKLNYKAGDLRQSMDLDAGTESEVISFPSMYRFQSEICMESIASADASDVFARLEGTNSATRETFAPAAKSKWLTILKGLLKYAATRNFYKLRRPWVQPDSLINKAMTMHGNLDLINNSRKRNRYSGGELIALRRGLLGIASLGSFENLDKCCRPYVASPTSLKRVAWCLLSMFFVLYDLVMLPMQVFDLPRHWLTTLASWLTQIFWSADIVLSFFTGVYDKGELEMRISRIAKIYAKTWLCFDLVITVPLWLPLIMDMGSKGESAAEGGRSLKVVRYFKIIRFLRLARLLKLEHTISVVLDMVNSPSILLSLGIARLMFCMVLLNHIVACIFFAVGKTKHNEEEVGWVARYDHRSTEYLYLTSVHWALTQFQGTTAMLEGSTIEERALSVTVVVLYLLVLCSFVSLLTNLMMELQSIHSQRSLERRIVRGYLNNHAISPHLALRVKKFLEWKHRTAFLNEFDGSIGGVVPSNLMTDLTFEVRSPLLMLHTVFHGINDRSIRVMRLICAYATKPIIPIPLEVVFDIDEPCESMYFIDTGTFHYLAVAQVKKTTVTQSLLDKDMVESHADLARHVFHGGQHLSECVLWVEWRHKGQLRSRGDASLLAVDADIFAIEVQKYTPLFAGAVLYARNFLAALSRLGKHYTDFIDAEAAKEMRFHDRMSMNS